MQDVGIERVYIKYDWHLFLRYVHYLLHHYLPLQFLMEVPSVPDLRPSELLGQRSLISTNTVIFISTERMDSFQTTSRLCLDLHFSAMWLVTKSMRCHVYSATLV